MLHTSEVILKLQLDNLGETKMFTSHGTDHVMVNGERYGHSIVVLAGGVRSDWAATQFDELTEAHFAYFLALKPDVLLLGTGATQRFPRPILYRALIDAGIGVEFMTTPAACRTYNILTAEDRNVIAAILI
ncbi:MAG: Mth938-like domain-containing protein [Nitrosomonadales bacterium]|nr:Mth938-like domain-containing protein [Nitrosomonadales bacterium]